MKKCKKRSMGLAFFVLAMVLIAVSFAGCHGGGGGGGGNPATPPAPDTTPPTVTSVTPKAGDTKVALNTTVTAAFSEALDETSVNASTFILKDGSGNAVPGTVTLDATNNMATLTPSANLAQSAAYIATITTGVKDKAGNALAADFPWSFTTGTVLDTTPPTVLSPTSPADGATGVSLASEVTATFSEPVNPATINGSTFTVAVSGGGGSVAGAVSLSSDGLTATFRPAAPFASYTAYTATITTGVKDLSGNAMAANKTWSFTTERDTTPPTVLYTVPENGQTGMLRNVSIQVTFSEPMSAATITNATFLVSAGSNTVAGQVTLSADSMTATFTPDAYLTDNTTYNCTITTGVTDLADNHLASDYSLNFEVGTVVDTTQPTVSTTTPTDGETGVDTNYATVSITAVFSEPMLASSVSVSTFSLVASGQTVTGAVTYDGPSKTAKFTPDIDLPKNTACTATVTTGVKDLAGNAMAANKTWSFKTRAEVNVPKTGQTTCDDGTGKLVSCGTTSIAGQDGALQRGMAWPDPRFVSGPTTTDSLTGLVWPTDAHSPACDLYTAGSQTWQDALDYVKCLNKTGYLGQNDWRLPNREELRSLLHYGQADTAAWLNGQGFANVISSGYWSSTTDVSTPTAAWVVSLKDGGVSVGGKSGRNNVWPVRGGQAGAPAGPAATGQKSCYDANNAPAACKDTGQDGESQTGLSVAGSRFTSGSGAEIQCVTDNLTGMMWAKVPPGTLLDKKSWQDALTYAEGLSLCGYTDWRLPNADELASLVNADQADQSAWLSQWGFVGIQADLYWTSTSVEHAAASAYAVKMSDGKVDNAVLKTETHYAWPVRGGIK